MPEGNDDFWSDGAEPNGEDFSLPETQGDHNLSGYVEAPMVEEAADTTSFEAHDSARPLSCIPFEPFLLGDGPSGQTQEEPQTKAVHAPIEPPTIEPMDIGMRVEAPPDAPEAEWHVAGIEQPTSQDSEQSFSEVPVNLGTALPEKFF
jgi:hypothetical protein